MAVRTGMAHRRSERRSAEPDDSSGVRMLRLPAAGAALDDLWDVYDVSYDAVTAATMRRIAEEGEAGALAQSVGTYRKSIQSPEVNREQLRAGMVDGEWGPYLGS